MNYYVGLRKTIASAACNPVLCHALLNLIFDYAVHSNSVIQKRYACASYAVGTDLETLWY